MNYGLYNSIGTVTAFIAFIAVCWWAYSPRNRKRFEDDGRIAIDTDPIYQQRQAAKGEKK